MTIFNAIKARFILAFVFLFASFHQAFTAQDLSNNYTNKFAGSMLAGGLGDALGRVTEFIKSTDSIFQQYPRGVRTFNDFLPHDWTQVPQFLKNKKIAPYTDDTAMAKLVMHVLIDAKTHNWDLDTTMDHIARSFITDSQDTKMGWIAPFRAPGNACIQGVKQLSNTLLWNKDKSLNPQWWIAVAPTAGGCGSVMRAHPFGLVFADNPEKAALWAAEHSRITHGDPIAIAACAAMATGVACVVQGESVEVVVRKMIEAAEKYDVITANKIEMAYMSAQRAKVLRKPYNNLFQAYENAEFRTFNAHVFSTFLGWSAHDAVAATVYAFALSSDNVMEAIYLGVHTPGDSDSIASMAGALVGARTGCDQLPKDLIAHLEGSINLRADAEKAAALFTVF